MTFPNIRAYIWEHLGEHIDDSTLRRAYDHARPEKVQEAAANGTRVERSRAILIGKEKRDRVQKISLERPQMTNAEIAKETGVSPGSVARIRRELVGRRPGGKRPKSPK